ncbi:MULTISPECIES: site-specific integrase [unclassified Sphingomonas]|uniref:site-specific integrase n=1 Tax=unclassified Sphingomonas TaxID=196159 RepID=UPI00027C96FB|nr:MULTISPECIES: site-specific integrase [unclassified Sphingomonas]EJU14177.1 integrase family protein [Sphingomonas sp. LH128]QDK35593.1 integrase [Sphingomonas sp. IC081]
MADGSEDPAEQYPPTPLIPNMAASAAEISHPGRILGEEIAAARSYRAQAKAANTIRAYTSDWSQFEGWCWQRDLNPLPARPEAVATYLAALALAGKADSTIGRHLAAIGWKHRQDGLVAPTLRDERTVIADTLAGIRREQRARPRARKAAITASELTAMIAAADGQGTRSIRDRAIMALGLAAALRRSELVGLERRDVELVDKGLKLTLRHSKTDQEGEGQVIAVPSGKTLKPVERLKAWLAVRGSSAGPLFYQIDPQGRLTNKPMSDRSVARLIQKYAGRAGLDPETVGGHSLRAGFLTEASRSGATIAKMQEVSRHKRVEVLLGYVRAAELFEDHAGKAFL